MLAINRLTNWFKSQCEGGLEHKVRIRIETLDNPGWMIKVDLSETTHRGRKVGWRLIERSDCDWKILSVEDSLFNAGGGPSNLAEIINTFSDFVEYLCLDGKTDTYVGFEKETTLDRLCEWYTSQCDGDWEHCYVITIVSTPDPGWLVTIELFETEWEDLQQPRGCVRLSDAEWFEREILGGKFVGRSSIGQLEKVLESFLEAIDASKTLCQPEP